MINTSALKKYVLLNIPYVLFFWFSNNLGEAFRLAPGSGFEQKFFGFSGTLSTALSNPLPSFNPQDLLVGLIGAGGIFLFVWYRKKNAKKWRKDMEYGSARCAVVPLRPHGESRNDRSEKYSRICFEIW